MRIPNIQKSSKKFFGLIFIGILLLLCLGTYPYAQEQHRLINFQGKLTDQQGEILDGTYTVVFSIYATPTGGTAIWTARHERLSISGGLVNVLLGSKELGSLDAITFDGPRYLGITIDVDNNENSPDPEMLPRQKIVPSFHARTADFAADSAHASQADHAIDATTLSGIDSNYLTSRLVPPGVICMWSGSVNNIPNGWALCNGTNGTPDLRDKFICGVLDSENPGIIGGSHSYNLQEQQLPQHKHKINPPDTITTESGGRHKHQINSVPSNYGGSVTSGIYHDHWFGITNKYTEESGDHSHEVKIEQFDSEPTGKGLPIDNRPAFYKLAFIMKL